MISLTHTILPDKELLHQYLGRIYKGGILTNNGPLVKEFESKLKFFLLVNNLLYVTSGHTANMMALNSLPSKGKIILSPFSFISTLNAVLWNGHTPVFADIERPSLSINPNIVEGVLRRERGILAIFATHLFGNVCDVEALELLSRKYKIPVIYDAAHAIGLKLKGKSVFNYGDILTTSFQAYKSLHSVEGGAVIVKDDEIYKSLFNMRYFGLDLKGNPVSIGINGKSSEIHAAFGLCSLNTWKDRRLKREKIYHTYIEGLSDLPIQLPFYSKYLESNYSYFNILVENEKKRNALYNYLFENGVESKKYFIPSLNTVGFLNKSSKMPISEDVSQRNLCIPIHSDLSEEEVQVIIETIRNYKF